MWNTIRQLAAILWADLVLCGTEGEPNRSLYPVIELMAMLIMEVKLES